MADRISIAMAVYNGARFLQEQLDSFADQTRLPDELVACDDGSTDDSLAILEAFASTAPFPVRIVRNEANIGCTKNFEQAMRLCAGDIIFLSDHDDVWFPERLARVSRAFEGQPRLMVVMNDHIITDEHLNRSGRTMLGNLARLGMAQSHMVAGCCSAHRKEWRDIILPVPDGAPAHDIWINEIAHELGVSSIIAEPLQLYRRHDATITNNITSAAGGLFIRRVRRALALKGGVGVMTRTLRYQEAKLKWYDSQTARLRSMGLGETAEARRREIEAERDVQQERLDAIRRPRIARAAAIWMLWRSGKYRMESGWKTAIKDLLRR